MTEITPGIYWLELPTLMADSDLVHVNAYLVQGDSGYLLVDAGWNTDESYAALHKQLAEIGVDIKDISQIVVTHVHPDHYGQAGRLKQLSGADVALHDIEKAFIESRYINMKQFAEQTTEWLTINGVQPEELEEFKNATAGIDRYIVPTYPDISLHGGETITSGRFSFQVIWTPGHSAGHICLYEPEKKILISGDHMLPKITPNVGRQPDTRENTLGDYIKSLESIRHLDVELILPGHEFPFNTFRPRIEELIRHHEERNQEVLAILKDGRPKTACQIARKISWGVTSDWQDIPFFHQRLAISETLAHLEYMTINGQLEKITRDGIIYYRQN
jgi:glyoxylase-like metal-dependent hydrolase (beta-lactamase superfamily II)